MVHKKVMRTIVLSLGLILLIILAGCGTKAPEASGNSIAQPSQDVDKTFVITGQNFKFMMNNQENPELRVKEGDKVRIEFSSTDGFHDWTVDEFNAATEKVQTGSSTSVEFIASKKGTFEYYCSVGSHRQEGMKGSLIVE